MKILASGVTSKQKLYPLGQLDIHQKAHKRRFYSGKHAHVQKESRQQHRRLDPSIRRDRSYRTAHSGVAIHIKIQ